MKDANKIYWWLYWDLSYDFLNKKVSENVRDKEIVGFFCKVIALKSMDKNLDEICQEVK